MTTNLFNAKNLLDWNPLQKEKYYYDFGTGNKIPVEKNKAKTTTSQNSGKATPQPKKEKDPFLEGFNLYSDKPETPYVFSHINQNNKSIEERNKERNERVDDFLAGFNQVRDEEIAEIREKERIFNPKTRDTAFEIGKDGRLVSPLSLEPINYSSSASTKEEEKPKEKSGWQKGLDYASTALTAASLIPGLDTVTNILQIPVDLLRGDFVGAGLDLVGVLPGVGEVADAAKTGRMVNAFVDGAKAAKTMNGIVDGVQATDKALDTVRVMDKASDTVKIADDVTDTAKVVENAGTTVKTASNAGELAKAYPKEQIPDEVKGYLSELVQEGQSIQVNSTPSLDQISLMSRQEAVEFASVSVGERNYIIRGNIKGTTIPQDVLDDMIQNKGVLICHSHPYIGDVQPSQSDLRLAEILNHQKEFRIVTPDGLQAIYTKDGIKSVGNIEKKLSEDDVQELYKLFGG